MADVCENRRNSFDWARFTSSMHLKQNSSMCKRENIPLEVERADMKSAGASNIAYNTVLSEHSNNLDLVSSSFYSHQERIENTKDVHFNFQQKNRSTEADDNIKLSYSKGMRIKVEKIAGNEMGRNSCDAEISRIPEESATIHDKECKTHIKQEHLERAEVGAKSCEAKHVEKLYHMKLQMTKGVLKRVNSETNEANSDRKKIKIDHIPNENDIDLSSYRMKVELDERDRLTKCAMLNHGNSKLETPFSGYTQTPENDVKKTHYQLPLETVRSGTMQTVKKTVPKISSPLLYASIVSSQAQSQQPKVHVNTEQTVKKAIPSGSISPLAALSGLVNSQSANTSYMYQSTADVQRESISPISASTTRTVDLIYQPSAFEKSLRRFLHPSGCPQCPYCAETFTNTCSVIVHVRTKHTEERPYMCCYCGSYGAHYAGMLEHVARTHHHQTSNHINAVHICSDSYNDICLYQKSSLAHRSRSEVYHCNFCSTRSSDYGNIQNHVHEHHRDYLCRVSTYMELDPFINAYVCPHCGEVWLPGTPGAKVHSCKMTDEDKLVCPVCQFASASPWIMMQHTRARHGIECDENYLTAKLTHTLSSVPVRLHADKSDNDTSAGCIQHYQKASPESQKLCDVNCLQPTYPPGESRTVQEVAGRRWNVQVGAHEQQPSGPVTQTGMMDLRLPTSLHDSKPIQHAQSSSGTYIGTTYTHPSCHSENTSYQKYSELVRLNKSIDLAWVPSHVGIKGNEKADTLVKEALNWNINNNKITHTDFKHKINKFIKIKWQSE